MVCTDEIFDFLESADKPCIIAIDEFQRIANYPEKNVEELLRGKIQKLSNTHIVFAQKQFSKSGKQLQKEAFDYVYDLFEGITSASFIKRHNLKSASAVQSASKALQESGILTKKGNTYSLSDPMTRIWLEQRH